MAQIIIDSYSETNRNGENQDVYTSQSFTGDGNKLGRADFYLLKSSGTPTGNMQAFLYAHSGTFGTSSAPTGSALASSSTVDASVLTGSYKLIAFNFDGTYTLINGTKYCIVVKVPTSGGDIVDIGADTSSPTHGGNLAYSTNGTDWTTASTVDTIFYVYWIKISPFPSHYNP